jgi:hypothetical protein
MKMPIRHELQLFAKGEPSYLLLIVFLRAKFSSRPKTTK